MDSKNSCNAPKQDSQHLSSSIGKVAEQSVLRNASRNNDPSFETPGEVLETALQQQKHPSSSTSLSLLVDDVPDSNPNGITPADLGLIDSSERPDENIANERSLENVSQEDLDRVEIEEILTNLIIQVTLETKSINQENQFGNNSVLANNLLNENNQVNEPPILNPITTGNNRVTGSVEVGLIQTELDNNQTEEAVSKPEVCNENNEPTIERENQKTPVDELIYNQIKLCWETIKSNNEIEKSLLRSVSNNEPSFWDPRFKGSFEDDNGLLHAIIKHGICPPLTKNPEWLKQLIKNCEKLKHETDLSTKDKLSLEIKSAIEGDFEQLIEYSKQLGEYIVQQMEQPSCPVFISFNERGIQMFEKTTSEPKRYNFFVLADGEGTYNIGTLVTRYKLRPRGFISNIKLATSEECFERSGIVPNRWINKTTGNVFFQLPSEINEAGLYFRFDRETVSNPIFSDIFQKTLMWPPLMSDDRYKIFMEDQRASDSMKIVASFNQYHLETSGILFSSTDFVVPNNIAHSSRKLLVTHILV